MVSLFGHGCNQHGQPRIVPVARPLTREQVGPKFYRQRSMDQEIAITAYLPTSGASFGPKAVASMAKAFDEAVAVIGIGPRDETKREAVARFILHLAEIDGGLNLAILRDKAIMALGGSIHVVISDDRSRGEAEA